jgi:hypothetical protein
MVLTINKIQILGLTCQYYVEGVRVMVFNDLKYVKKYVVFNMILGHRGRDCMVVGFTTTYAISAYARYHMM